MLERLFGIEANGTTVRREVIGGASTFMTMSYILFVQPAVLSMTGMDFGAVMVATALSSALATFLMAFLANYPIALAPAMGHNFFFAFTICGPLAMGGLGYSWSVALGANFISGALFVALALVGFRERILEAVPEALRHAIAVGIGLLIALVGMKWGGWVVAAPGTYIGLGSLKSPPALLTAFGLLVTGGLMALRVQGAVIIGILATAAAAWPFGMVSFHGFVSAPPSLGPTFFKLDILGALKSGAVTVVLVLFFLDLFDTIGTLIGISEQAGLMRDGKLPRAGRALLADALGTVAGTCMGTSTVTSYIESAAGVSQGSRTGLSNVVTGLLLVAAVFFAPLARTIGEGVTIGGVVYRPVVAPVLIIIGSLMLKSVARIPMDDLASALPAFLTMIVMPFTFSITEGIAFGFISTSLLMALTGRAREVSWIVHCFALLFLLRYIVL
jgi:AGZA family xanthine/uracil permease-like MFS transporter